MQYHNVQEYDGNFNLPCPTKDIDLVHQYNGNDTDSTYQLLEMKKNDIELRLNAEEKYGISALNKDGVNLGMEILKQQYLKKTGLSWADIKDLRSPCESLKLKNIIFDFIEFETPELQNLLKDIKQVEIDPEKDDFQRIFYIGNLKHVLAKGGIHSVSKQEIIIPTKTQVLVDQDVTSLYPSIIIEHKVYPKHLGVEFLETFTQIKEDRVRAKRSGDKLTDATLKLSINGCSGNFQSPYSWVYDPECAYKIRINGELMLLMLVEKLHLLGVQLLNNNTDGTFYLADIQQLPQIQQICNWWENKTKMKLEADYFERFYQYAINDYLGVKQGYSETKNSKLIKKKGLFIDEVTLGKGMAPMIIPKAINEYFINGTPVEDTIKNCTDILQFCTYQKVDKKFQVLYGDEPVRHINRYYMSMNGKSLTKKDPLDTSGRKPTALCADSGVTIYNTFDDKPIEERYINYRYYIKECYKIIDKMETKQLSLF